MTLFDEPQIEYRLFDAQRLRFLPIAPRLMSEAERREADEYFERSRCPHLQWKSDREQSRRAYTIRN